MHNHTRTDADPSVADRASTAHFTQACHENNLPKPVFVLWAPHRHSGFCTYTVEKATRIKPWKVSKAGHPPCFVVADEFYRFASNDFVDALNTLRNYGVYFILSHQFLAQLVNVEGLREAVLTNCANRICFSVFSEDAEVLSKEMHSGYIDYERVKDEIETMSFRPVQRWVVLR